MPSPRWCKVLRDLWVNKKRTVLVVLSIAVNVFALGVVTHMRVIVSRDLAASYVSVNPASATIHTIDPFDDGLVEAVRHMPEVGEAEGRRSVIARFKLESDDEWHPIEVFAIPDYDNIHVNIVRPEIEFEPDPVLWPHPNTWPPPEREVLIERTSLLFANLGLAPWAELGDTILVKTPSGGQRGLRMAGLVYDFARLPATNAGRAYGYVTFDTLEWLGEPRNFNELHIVVAEDTCDKEHIMCVVDQVRDKVERSGYTIFRTNVPEPGKSPLDYQFQALSLVLGALGLFSLPLSGFLVTNMISSLLAQQIRQVGMMKAIGGRQGQIAGIYLSLVLILGLLSLVIAVPLGALAAREFINFMAYFINFNKLTEFHIPLEVLGLEVAVGLLVPLVAALYPIISGTQITVREALSSCGIEETQLGAGFIDRLVERVRGLPRPLLLSLRNTFRQKGRLTLTLVVLILGGTVFIAVSSVRASMNLTLEDLLRYWQFDVQVGLSRPYPIEKIEYKALRVPGVTEVEGWVLRGVYRVRPDDSESQTAYMLATPIPTDMLEPVILQGRWLLPGDENAIVISVNFLATEPDIVVGDEIVLKIKGRETTWRVVGVVQTVGAERFVYANYSYFARVVHEVGRVNTVQIMTEKHDPAFQSQVAKALQSHFESAGMRVDSAISVADLRAGGEAYFTIIVTFLLFAAILLAVVGGFGLMGTMSINVLERTREIGIMRAVGASDGAVQQIFVAEGILIGLLSWPISVMLALLLSKSLSDAVGVQFLQAPLSYTFSTSGALLWLILVVILGALATYLPAQDASRLAVSQALAYE